MDTKSVTIVLNSLVMVYTRPQVVTACENLKIKITELLVLVCYLSIKELIKSVYQNMFYFIIMII